MRFLGIMLLCGGIALGQAPLRNPHTSSADEAAGAKIFRSHCADCHGLNGEGGKGPNLTTGVFFHGSNDENLFNNISDGIAGTAMPGQFFSDDQVWQIVAYVRTLSQRNAGVKVNGDAVRGAAAFRERGCSQCHLVRGEGRENGPELSVIGSQRSVAHLMESIVDPNAKVAREYWVAKVTLASGATYSGFVMNEDTWAVQLLDPAKGLQALSRRDIRKLEIDKHSLMPSFKDRISDQEVNDLVAYLVTLQRERMQ